MYWSKLLLVRNPGNLFWELSRRLLIAPFQICYLISRRRKNWSCRWVKAEFSKLPQYLISSSEINEVKKKSHLHMKKKNWFKNYRSRQFKPIISNNFLLKIFYHEKYDRPLDEAFCQETVQRLWEAGRAATEWTNLTLQPPPGYVIELFAAAAQNKALADELADNFNAPERNWPIFSSPEGAAAVMDKFTGR